MEAAAPSRAGNGPEPGDARADGRVPGGRWMERAGARWRTPSARPRGARRGRPSLLRSRQLCLLRWALGPACPVPGAGCRVSGPCLSPALPPSLRPALRAPRSGSHRRRPQPFIAAAASAGVAHWLGRRVPASSRLPTARQVEASACRRTRNAENEYAEASDSGSLVPVDPESCLDTVLVPSSVQDLTEWVKTAFRGPNTIRRLLRDKDPDPCC